MQEQEELLPQQEAEIIKETEITAIVKEAETEEPIKTIFYNPYKTQGMSNWSQFGLLLGMLGVGILAASFVSLLVVKLMMPHSSIFNLEKEMFKPENASAMKVMQLASTLMMFFLPAFLFATIVHKKPFSFLGFNKKISLQQIGFVIIIAWMAIFVGGILGDLNERIPIPKHLQDSFRKAEDAYNDQVLAIAKMNNIKDYLLALIIIALAPAIVEETFFRGTVQQFLIRWFGNPWIAIFVTSVIFSAIHFSYYGFLTRASLGIILGLLFYYSKNIWLNILAHFLNNAIAVTILYIYSLHGKPPKEALDDHFPIWLGIIGGVFLFLALMKFKRASELVLNQNKEVAKELLASG